MTRARVAILGWLLIALASPAFAQDAPTATWRSRLSPMDSMFVTEGVRGQVMMRVPGRYVAVGFWNAKEFVGVAREPEFEPGEDPIGIVRHRSFPARKISDSLMVTSLREGKLVQDVNTETWELTAESAEAFSARIDAANLPRTDKLPAPGDFVAFDEAPVVLEPAQLQAPDSLLDAKHTRTVLLRVLVNKDGHVLRTAVLKSQKGLDSYAEQAAMATRFRPAMRRGRAVVAWTTFPVEFKGR
ncbi:MAG: energy transducer TonB [Candidatus Eisenbacteria bacterium]|nr:energy transducer TonB [Candidatus Eisenbacteria bacterium]